MSATPPIPIDLLRRLRDSAHLTHEEFFTLPGWATRTSLSGKDHLSEAGIAYLDLLEENERLRADLGRVVHELRGLAVFNFPSGPPAPPITEPVVAEALAQVGAEMDRLAKEVERLTPKWRDGEPPEGVFVWRAGRVSPVETERIQGVMHFIGLRDEAIPWGSARWAPTARPPAAADEAP